MSINFSNHVLVIRRVMRILPVLIILMLILNSSVGVSTDSQEVDRKMSAQEMISSTFTSAQQLIKSVAARPLKSDPLFDNHGGLLATTEESGSPEDLVRPQLQLSRDLETLLDGTRTDTPNQLRIDATGPAGGGRNLCRISLAFSFTPFSPLASGDLTVDRALQALEDTARDRIHVWEVFVSPETTYDGTAILDSSSLSSAQIIYHAELGGFLTQPPGNRDLRPTTDTEFTQINQLLAQVTECITHSFEQDRVSDDSAPSQTSAMDENQLLNLGVCTRPCIITGRVAFQHPTWGSSNLLTTVALDVTTWEAHIIVVDSSNKIQWRYDTSEWTELSPANDTPDKSGNIFITYNPGRYDGIVALQPSAGGFNHFGTLPENTYFGRFYGATIADVDSDGTFEVVIDKLSCDPDCATNTVYSWNGAEYVEE